MWSVLAVALSAGAEFAAAESPEGFVLTEFFGWALDAEYAGLEVVEVGADVDPRVADALASARSFDAGVALALWRELGAGLPAKAQLVFCLTSIALWEQQCAS